MISSLTGFGPVKRARFVLALVAAFIAGCSDDVPTADATVDAAADVDLTVHCDADLPADASSPEPTFANVRSFFLRRCAAGAACHGPGGQGGLALTGASLHADLVGHPSRMFPVLPRVAPGNPDRSFLWLKVTGCFAQLPGCRAPGGTCGDPMPTLSPISEGFSLPEAAVVRAWIVAGAPP